MISTRWPGMSAHGDGSGASGRETAARADVEPASPRSSVRVARFLHLDGGGMGGAMGAASSRTTERTSLPRLSVRDTGGVLADVVMPLFARGVIIRRPRVVGLLDRMDADARAVRRLRDLRSRYGDGPVLLGLPGREVAVVLSAEDVHRVLRQSPDTFAPANAEKRAALGHFQPHGVLISDLRSRTDRRRFNDAVLD